MIFLNLIMNQLISHILNIFVYIYNVFLYKNTLIISLINFNSSQSILLYFSELKFIKIFFYSFFLEFNLLNLLLNILFLVLFNFIFLIILYFCFFKIIYNLVYLNFFILYKSLINSFTILKFVYFEILNLKFQNKQILIYYKQLLNINIKRLLIFSGLLISSLILIICFDILIQIISSKNDLYNLNIYNQNYYFLIKNNNFDYKYLNYINHFCLIYIITHIIFGFYMIFFDYLKEKAFILFLLIIIIILNFTINIIIIINFQLCTNIEIIFQNFIN